MFFRDTGHFIALAYLELDCVEVIVHNLLLIWSPPRLMGTFGLFSSFNLMGAGLVNRVYTLPVPVWLTGFTQVV